MSFRKLLDAKAKMSPPSWMADNLAYETQTGSTAYGVTSNESDIDIYGVVFPPLGMIFPHVVGEIPGFGNQIKRFETWQEHHIQAFEKSYDFQIYGIVKFFQLAMDNNPNIIDVLFTPRRCVLSSTAVGEYMREHRKDFLHKGAFVNFKSYSYSQLNKIKTKKPDPGSKRAVLVEQYGYDVKYAMHLVRLLLECQQILCFKDLDLEQDREQLKGVRRGDWTLEYLEQWAKDKEKDLEKLYSTSTLQYSPDEALIKSHLIHCLEMHYGNLSKAVTVVGETERILRQIAQLTSKYH